MQEIVNKILCCALPLATDLYIDFLAYSRLHGDVWVD